MRRVLLAAAAAVVAVGCATTTGSAPRSSRSGFDGARVVDIAGHGAACTSMVCPGLGAQWSDKTPTVVVVTVHLFNEIAGITGAQLAIDGRVVALRPMPGLTTFSKAGSPVKESQHSYTTQLQTMRDLVAAKRVWLRVTTTTGYVESAILDGQTDSKAFHAMRRFLAEVDGTGPPQPAR